MCLDEIFKKACEKEYRSCKTATSFRLPKPVKDIPVAILGIVNQKCQLVKECIYCGGKARDKKILEELRKENLSKICMVLESPHIDEYNSNGEPIGPAIGATGKNIKEHITAIIDDALSKNVISLESGTYLFVLVEAVQFQCSNGNDLAIKDNRDKRNAVFKEVWNSGGKEAFLKRIRKLDPELIIISCTGGISNIEDAEFLNGMVRESFNGYETPTVSSAHPSSPWFWRKPLKPMH